MKTLIILLLAITTLITSEVKAQTNKKAAATTKNVVLNTTLELSIPFMGNVAIANPSQDFVDVAQVMQNDKSTNIPVNTIASVYRVPVFDFR